MYERIETITQHGPRPVRHARQVHIRLQRRFLIKFEGALTNIPGDVPDAFEIGRDLQAGHNEAQVARRRLVERQEAGARVVYGHVEVVNHVVARDDLLSQGGVPLNQ